uniref:Uncharacterized protein n=1 Tax=Culicoides sonorensis TaxID=179676 RepID=Q5QBK1_CULSO|nr:unknown [Culicoides sonorensis]
MVNFKLSIIFVTLFSVYLCVQALECYSCANCPKPNGNAKCNSGEVCAVWTVKNNATNSTTTSRGCKPSGYCAQQNPLPNVTCTDCNKDKCNEAPGLKISVTTMLATVAGVILVSRF